VKSNLIDWVVCILAVATVWACGSPASAPGAQAAGPRLHIRASGQSLPAGAGGARRPTLNTSRSPWNVWTKYDNQR
jgi:hypothetical protein